MSALTDPPPGPRCGQEGCTDPAHIVYHWLGVSKHACIAHAIHAERVAHALGVSITPVHVTPAGEVVLAAIGSLVALRGGARIV